MISRMCLVAVIASALGCGGGSPNSSAPAPSTTAPPIPAGPAKPLETATITITSSGFRLDSTSAASFNIDDLHVYEGSRITFVNNDTDPHDVLSDPFGAHNDCPEINAAGYLVPGQSRATDPLTRLRRCGFHDHNHEGDPAFGGAVTAEMR